MWYYHWLDKPGSSSVGCGITWMGIPFQTWVNLLKWFSNGYVRWAMNPDVFFNMEPENDGFQKESPFPEANFQVPCYAELICHGKQRGPRAAQVCIKLHAGFVQSNWLLALSIIHLNRKFLQQSERWREIGAKMNPFLVRAPWLSFKKRAALSVQFCDPTITCLLVR